MNYTHLGRTGLKVSRLCLGTMNFGDVTDEKTSARILDEALEAGINFIDTQQYGTEQSPDIQQGSGCPRKLLVAGSSRVAASPYCFGDETLSAYGLGKKIAVSLLIMHHIRKAWRTVCDGLKVHTDVYLIASHDAIRHVRGLAGHGTLVQQGKALESKAISRAGTLDCAVSCHGSSFSAWLLSKVLYNPQRSHRVWPFLSALFQ
jgi:aryl-alcohol dehydrogenase-like predicted oxidoreductase